MELGQIVFSKQGRDKGKPFIICRMEGFYLYLADGKLRKFESPKKKKVIHIAKTNYVDSYIVEVLENVGHIKNSDLRNAIKRFLNRKEV